MTYKTRVALVYGLALLVLLAVAVVSQRDLHREYEMQKLVAHTHTVIQTIQDVTANLAEAEAARRGFALSADTRYRQSFAVARDQIRRDISDLYSLMADNPSQQRRLGQLKPALERRIDLFQTQLDSGIEEVPNRAAQMEMMRQGEMMADQVRKLLSDATNEEEQLLMQRSRAVEASARAARWFATLGYAVGIFLILTALFILRKEIADRERAQIETQRAKDGLEHTVQLRTSELRRVNEELHVEIEERKRAERYVQEANAGLELRVAERTEELTRSNKEMEAFSYSVSHDLRAPLRHIDGFARILKEEHAAQLSEEGLGYLDRVLQAANHMGHLVDDLLNLARIGRREIVRQAVNPDGAVRQAIADLPPETQERSIEWRIEPLPQVDCDPGLLKLVFSNLLSNAVKFTRNQQPAVIEVGARQTSGALAFFVRDNGVGFDPKYADKLFGVFQRLHRQEDFEGTGIGLATVQRIIHRHGGEAWAESEPGKGATFFFTLGPQPMQPLEKTEEEAHVDRT